MYVRTCIGVWAVCCWIAPAGAETPASGPAEAAVTDEGKPEHRVLITARHHSCETMASFVLEGIVESVLTDPARQWSRDNVEFLVVPFMDKDGVEDGDQGKSRSPHDHNRDYGGQIIYPTVRRPRQITPGWADGKLRMALDLHCPYIRGGRNETLCFVGPENQALWSNIQRFSGILEALMVHGLRHRSKGNLPFGKEWNTPERRGPGKSMSGWAGEIRGIGFASTLETPYANASGVEVTPETARVLGNRLAEAIERFLRE